MGKGGERFKKKSARVLGLAGNSLDRGQTGFERGRIWKRLRRDNKLDSRGGHNFKQCKSFETYDDWVANSVTGWEGKGVRRWRGRLFKIK